MPQAHIFQINISDGGVPKTGCVVGIGWSRLTLRLIKSGQIAVGDPVTVAQV